ncbi:DUF4199 domain-containing protein [Flavobacterium sp. '19STA2R22 D10 B1']|uniref:DUF4199 domain-containing protein n=1 Tax=Flavobacterium aerium TaxID=3037261 RepID=UPI00278C77A2|nr:DUF4199 domain-containing protein [Flavobacterium sp. '19STA2R22 D10 B1']
MKETISPSKSALQLGILFGVIMVLEFVISYVLHLTPTDNPSAGMIMSILNYFVLPVVFITIGCINYKKNFNGGFISFGQCLKIGVSITVLAALIYSIFYIIFIQIFPDFLDSSMADVKTVMLKNNPEMTKDQIETAISVTRKFMSPWILAPSTMAIYAFIGLIFSLIVGAFVKNDKPTGY